jgi:hypothetical protein
MRHFRFVRFLAALAILAPISFVGASPYDPVPVARGKFGAKLGMIYSTHFRVDGVSEDAELGISAGVLFDLPLFRRGIYGVSIDLHDLHIFEKRKKMLDLSILLKYRFVFDEQRWEMRAVAAAGFGYVTAVDKLERTTFLTLKTGIETVFHSNTRYSLIIDGLVMATPSGGNRDHKVTYGPTFLLRAGFIY